MYISPSRLEYFLTEDLPYYDISTELLGLKGQKAAMSYYTREDCILCGSEHVKELAQRLGLSCAKFTPSGTRLKGQEHFLELTGDVAALHALWKVGLNLLDNLSSISTRTHIMCEQVKKAQLRTAILGTRKHMPGTKDLMIYALHAGGGMAHRLNLSDSILFFKEHQELYGGFEPFLQKIPDIRHQAPEKKIGAEASVQEAWALAQTGIDIIQFDKAEPQDLAQLVPQLKANFPQLILVAAGGICADNAYKFALTGVDALVSSWMYSGKPIDMSVHLSSC